MILLDLLFCVGESLKEVYLNDSIYQKDRDMYYFTTTTFYTTTYLSPSYNSLHFFIAFYAFLEVVFYV